MAGWSGKRRAGVGEEARVLRRRQFAPPAGSEHRLVEEDPPADVDEDQPLAPAPGVLAGLGVLRRGEPLLEEAEVAAAQSAYVPPVSTQSDQHRDRAPSAGAAIAADAAIAISAATAQVEAEQARERRAER